MIRSLTRENIKLINDHFSSTCSFGRINYFVIEGGSILNATNCEHFLTDFAIFFSVDLYTFNNLLKVHVINDDLATTWVVQHENSIIVNIEVIWPILIDHHINHSFKIHVFWVKCLHLSNSSTLVVKGNIDVL